MESDNNDFIMVIIELHCVSCIAIVCHI